MELKFECCFCGKGIQSNKTDPCNINVTINMDKSEEQQYEQDFFCHLNCLKDCLTSNVPFYIEHLAGT